MAASVASKMAQFGHLTRAFAAKTGRLAAFGGGGGGGAKKGAEKGVRKGDKVIKISLVSVVVLSV
jgi:hypothetical protein